MIKRTVILFLSIVLFGMLNAQEDQQILQAQPEGSKGSQDLIQTEDGEVIDGTVQLKEEEKKKEKKVKKKKGPFLVATNSKLKKTREFVIGEKVSYLAKTDKKVQRGKIEEIDGDYVKINGKRVKVKNLVMVKKKFAKTMGWRTVGLTQLGIGTGVAAVGAGIAIFSFNQIDPDSLLVIWGAFGTVVGTGVGLVGTHLMLKGAKGFFQSSKLKSEKGWKFDTKMR